jgi:hypothetical protein
MNGTIIDVIGGGTLYLLIVATGERIANQPVEHRCMSDIVDGEGLSSPADLVGREVSLADDGMSVSFP